MTSFGKKAIDLVKELLSHDPESLPPYNEELVRLVLNDVGEHQNHFYDLVASVISREKERLGLPPDEELPEGMLQQLCTSVANLCRLRLKPRCLCKFASHSHC